MQRHFARKQELFSGSGQREGYDPGRSRLPEQGGTLGQGSPGGDHVVHQHHRLSGQVHARQQPVGPLDIGQSGAVIFYAGLSDGVAVFSRVGTAGRPDSTPTRRASSSPWS